MFRPELTTYDVLGYMVPGGGLLCIISVFEYYARTALKSVDPTLHHIHTPVLSGLRLAVDRLAGQNWLASAVGVAVLVGLAYLGGHLVASLSSILIDKMFISRGYGYPYEQLLGMRRNRLSDRVVRAFHRGLFFWLTLALLGWFLAGCNASFISARTRSLGDLAMSIARTLATGAVPLVVLLLWFRSRRSAFYRRLYDVVSDVGAFRMFYIATIEVCWSGLYDLFASILSRYLNTRRAFNEEFRALYRREFKDAFTIDPYLAETNNFWLPYLYIKTHSTALDAAATNWLTLYSFARNLAATFYLGFLYCCAWTFLQRGSLIAVDSYRAYVFVGIPLMFVGASAAMMMTYYNLYVAYYTKFVLRSFVYLRLQTATSRTPAEVYISTITSA